MFSRPMAKIRRHPWRTPSVPSGRFAPGHDLSLDGVIGSLLDHEHPAGLVLNEV
jgi:hypothetical protein